MENSMRKEFSSQAQLKRCLRSKICLPVYHICGGIAWVIVSDIRVEEQVSVHGPSGI